MTMKNVAYCFCFIVVPEVILIGKLLLEFTWLFDVVQQMAASVVPCIIMTNKFQLTSFSYVPIEIS